MSPATFAKDHMSIPKSVPIEEFCEFLNDDEAWQSVNGQPSYYFDDFDVEYHEKMINDVEGKDARAVPVTPGSMVNLKKIDATIYWQGKGEAKTPVPDTLVLFFIQWREKRNFVYITLKVPKNREDYVRKTVNDWTMGVEVL